MTIAQPFKTLLKANLDGDEFGDDCDSDIDNDGISNEIENTYSFLDPRDASDALADQDNDGASNLYEINNGNDPATPDAYAQFNLFDYYPLGEFTKQYSNGSSTSNVTMSFGNQTDTFIVETDYDDRLQLNVQSNCIMLQSLPIVGQNFPSLSTVNWCELPTSISEGQTMQMTNNIQFLDTDTGEAYQSFDVIRELELVNYGTNSGKLAM